MMMIYKMQRLEVSVAVRPIYGSLGVKRLRNSGVNISASAYAFVACIGAALVLLCNSVTENGVTNTTGTQCKNTGNRQNTP